MFNVGDLVLLNPSEWDRIPTPFFAEEYYYLAKMKIPLEIVAVQRYPNPNTFAPSIRYYIKILNHRGVMVRHKDLTLIVQNYMLMYSDPVTNILHKADMNSLTGTVKFIKRVLCNNSLE